MPGSKSRTIQRRKRHPPVRKAAESEKAAREPTVSSRNDSTPSLPTIPATTVATGLDSAPSTSTSTPALTATAKKLAKSPYLSLPEQSSDESELEMYDEFEGKGVRLFELEGLQKALESVACRECGTGRIVLRENLHLRQGLYTEPYLVCEECSNVTKVPFSRCTPSKAVTINRQSVFAAKCIGGSLASLQMFCAMLNLPPPVSKASYVDHMKEVKTQAVAQAQYSMTAAREQVREYYNVSDDDLADITVSCDGTWHRRGFSSLFGAVFIISHDTVKVLDYTVKSKHCASCSHWEARDHDSEEYREWKGTHKCDKFHWQRLCYGAPRYIRDVLSIK